MLIQYCIIPVRVLYLYLGSVLETDPEAPLWINTAPYFKLGLAVLVLRLRYNTVLQIPAPQPSCPKKPKDCDINNKIKVGDR